MPETMRTETEAGVPPIVLSRPEAYNTITPTLRRELATPGDEIRAPEAARIGMILEAVPDERLADHAFALAARMAGVPTNQLVMLKLLCNQTAENMGMASSRLLGSLFDGIARHTQEGLDFVTRAGEVGFRQAVRERDDPFGDYGAGPRSKGRR